MKPARILIVEDEFIVGSDLETQLLDLGYGVAGKADNGPAAIELARATQPELVLMDIRLKGAMDGIMAAEEIRRRFQLPVVFLTAYAEDNTLQRAQAAEPFGYVLKPFEQRELRTMIEIALYKHKAEREIRRWNQLYAALNQINETIIRVQSSAQLFEEICRIGAQYAGFKVVWIGRLDSQTQEVIPVARAGESAGYLDHIRVYADDRAEGCGPVGASIRQGSPCIVNDLAKDPRMAPWREIAAAYGLRAAAALPIRCAGKVCGAFTVYADEPGAFRDKEKALLEEATLNLSFALDHLEQVEQLRKLSRAVEQSPVSIVITDQCGVIEYVNPTFCAHTGYTPEEVLGRNPRMLKSGEMSSKGYEQLWKTILAGKEWRGQFHNKKKNGELYWESASISPIVDGAGVITHFLGVKEDITESRRVEEALRQREEEFRAMFEVASIGIAQADPRTGRWLRVNQKMCAITGYSGEELLRMRIAEVTHPEDQPRDWDQFQRVIRGEAPDYRLEKRYVRKDGAVAWVSVNMTVIRDAAGQPIRTMATIEDITERKQAECERQAMETQLRQAQKLEAVGQLAAGIAHEINTPTQYVGDNTRFVQDSFATVQRVLRSHQELLCAVQENRIKPELVAAAQDVLQRCDLTYLSSQVPAAISDALEGIERIAKIVRAMKEFSHPGGAEKIPSDINHAIETTTTVARNEWKYVAELSHDFDPLLPPVPCFLGEFNQAILNLIVNAAHAIGEVVRQAGGTKGSITIRTRRCGNHAEVSVTDTGTGIPETARSHIFEPFFTTKPVGKGTGQGLALVYACIVKRHGGTVSFETETGKGTTFILRMPFGQSPPPGQEGTPSIKTLSQGHQPAR